MLDAPPQRDRFPVCLAILFPIEGGYSNRPAKHDPGGATNFGVTHKTYDAWRRSKGLPTQDVRKITRAECEAIYREWFWLAVRADQLPPGLDLAAFDFCVNSGAGKAISVLQKVLGIPADGHFGPVTFEAIHAIGDLATLISKYVDARRAFFRGLSTYPHNPGWEKRANHIERQALIMSGESRWEVEAPPPPLPDPAAQAAATGKAVAQDPKPPAKIELLLGGTSLTGLGTGIGNAFTEISKMAEPTAFKITFAFLGQGLIWGSLIVLISTVFVHLWRKKFST